MLKSLWDPLDEETCELIRGNYIMNHILNSPLTNPISMEGKGGSINVIIITQRKKLKRKGKLKNETTGDGANKILWIQTWRTFANDWKKKIMNNYWIQKTNEYFQPKQ